MSDTMSEEPAPEAGGIEETRAAVRAVMASDNLTLTAIATMAGIPYGTFSSFMGGTYKGRNEELARKTQTWIASRETRARTRSAMPEAPSFVRTTTAAAILQVLQHAQHAPDLAVVAGGAGIGKTTTVQEYARRAPNVWVLTAQPVMSSPHAFISELAEMLKIEGGGWDRRARAILRQVAGTSGLLIVDEAQHLSTRALDQVRAVHDLAGLGVALVGNESVYDRLQGEARRPQFAQLFSRIGMRMTRGRPLTADIDALLEAWSVHGATECRLLRAVANKPGALRGLTKVLRMSLMAAASDGVALQAQHIRAAAAMLGVQMPDGDVA